MGTILTIVFLLIPAGAIISGQMWRKKRESQLTLDAAERGRQMWSS